MLDVANKFNTKVVPLIGQGTLNEAIEKIQNNYDIYTNGVKKLKSDYYYKNVYKNGFSALEKQL